MATIIPLPIVIGNNFDTISPGRRLEKMAGPGWDVNDDRESDMGVDVMVLNTAVTDFRRREFAFAEKLVGPGGLAKCKTKDMPDYTQKQYRQWILDGSATAGGPGNAAPLIARAGLSVAVGVCLGKGDFEGLDAQGRFFYDTLTANKIDMSQTLILPDLPTGTTFIYDKPGSERGGIAYFPNANNAFDFDHFRRAVETLRPRIVYYMYSGLSDRGDANGGCDLAEFVRFCRGLSCVTIADSHTLTGDPHSLIRAGKPIDEYKLLDPLLSELDVFFTSADEAQMIENTLGTVRDWRQCNQSQNCTHFLKFIADRYGSGLGRSRLFGITVNNGAWYMGIDPSGNVSEPVKTESRFMVGDVIDLVGAGDSFRSGLITYMARNLSAFQSGTCRFDRAVQMGNLFASMFIKAPLNDRYGHIFPYDKMAAVVATDRHWHTIDELLRALQ